ncbi:flippase [Candidatus Curtissbacteria bacterium]|nr:flippase [Candidatus Curtissbacteria bacterium]
MVKKVFYNVASQILGKGLTATATFIVTILISRALGEAGYGDFTKIAVFVGYFYTLADFGLNSIYVKIADDKNQISLLKTLLGTRLLMAIALAATAIMIGFLVPYNPVSATGFSPLVKIGIAIASLTIITQALYTTTNAMFQRKLRYDLSTIAVVFGAFAVLAGTFLVTLQKGGLLAFTSIYVVQGVVNVTLAFLFIKKLTGLVIFPKFILSQAKKIISGAWPVGTALVLNLIYFRIDVFILSSVRSSAEVGVYGLAYQFFEAALTVPIFFANSIYPPLQDLARQDFSQFKSKVKFWLLTLAGISLLLVAFLVVIANFIPVIYQGRFTGSVLSLKVLALGMPFFFASALLWHTLIIFGKQKFLILIYGAGALFNLIANLIFIPRYGYMAASAITVISEALVLALLAIAYIYFSKKVLSTEFVGHSTKDPKR